VHARGLSWLLALALLASLSTKSALASVTLASFTVTAEDGQVRVKWVTATELDNAGFYVQRSTSENGTYGRVSSFILAQGDPLTGASYEYIDSDVTNGMQYWYKLEAIDLGQNAEFFGPIWAIPGEPTPTATQTFTATPPRTPTQTATNASVNTLTPTTTGTQGAAPTSTRTQVLPTSTSGTAYPAPTSAQLQPTLAPPTIPPQPTKADLTPLASPSPIVTGVLTATATLLPLPDITLTFPEGGIVLKGRGTATSAPAAARSSTTSSGWSPVGGVLLISVVVLIWIILGVWFYMSFRHVE